MKYLILEEFTNIRVNPLPLTRLGNDPVLSEPELDSNLNEVLETMPFFEKENIQSIYSNSERYINEYLRTQNYSYAINRMKNNGLMSNNVANVATLYLDALNNYVEGSDDLTFVMNQYAYIITNSTDLTDEEKSILFTYLYVSKSSFEFWKERL